MTATYDTVSLFAGPGGLCLAAHANGLRPVGIEFDPDACLTRRAAGLPTIEGDVRDHSPADFPDAHTLIGGPPCQTFTVAGNGAGRRALDTVIAAARTMATTRTRPARDQWADERTGLVLEPLWWILNAKDNGHPYRTIVLEQVPAVLPVWQAYCDLLAWEGYDVHFGRLRAEQYGTPQTRSRAILIASLDGPVTLTAPTHRPYVKGVDRHEGDPALSTWRSMQDALPDRGPFVAVSNYGTGGDPKNRGRRSSLVPSATVTGKIFRTRLHGPDGNELPRYTPSEAGLLQGFPADYPWSGRDIGQQIGNACPVQLGAAVIGAALAPTRALTAA